MLTGFTFCIPLKSKCAEDVIKAYIDHICCTFGQSRKILTDNGTEFKNKLWTEVFEKLKIEQKFTPIYSPQCNGRIEGFHKFLKARIAKQLETRVEWDDLVWKTTAAYNFFPTLHLNHLLGSRMTNYNWPFGTLLLGLFGSNLDTRDLETYPRTYSGHF